MKRKHVGIIMRLLILATLMFAEYRFIMNNINAYIGKENTVYIEIFGKVDEYNAEKTIKYDLVEIRDINDK